jgi:hypothetical protein
MRHLHPAFRVNRVATNDNENALKIRRARVLALLIRPAERTEVALRRSTHPFDDYFLPDFTTTSEAGLE